MILSTNILQLLEDAQTPYWVLMSKGQKGTGGHPRIAQYSTDVEDFSIEDSMELLKKMLDMLCDGKYIIKFARDEKQFKAGFQEVEFIVTGKPYSNNSAQNISGIGNVPNYNGNIANIGEVVNEKVEAILAKRELEELRKKVAEHEQLKEDPSGFKTQAAKILGTLNDQYPQLVGPLVAEVLGIVKGIAGIFKPATLSGHTETYATIPHKPAEQNKNNFTEMNPEQTTEIEQELEANNEAYAQVIFRLRTLDPDLLNTLTKMADKAESNPKMIDTIKMFL